MTNPVEQLARLLNEVTEPIRSASERRFAKKHEPEIVTDPAVGDFFQRLRDMGYGMEYSRPADQTPEISRLIYERALVGETVVGIMEDTGDRISIIPTNRYQKGIVAPRYSVSLVRSSGEMTRLKEIAISQAMFKSDGLRDYLIRMMGDLVGPRNINWVIQPIDPLQTDTGVPTHRRAQEALMLGEGYNAGSVKLKDGTSVQINKEKATLLNKLLDNLNAANRKKMVDVLLTDKDGFEEILGFAQEYDE